MKKAGYPATTNRLHGCRGHHWAPPGLQSRQSTFKLTARTTFWYITFNAFCRIRVYKWYTKHSWDICLASAYRCSAYEVTYFSPIYWMVPQMVKALPPLSSRRDKPKSAKRRCPGKDHFINVNPYPFLKHPWVCDVTTDAVIAGIKNWNIHILLRCP